MKVPVLGDDNNGRCIFGLLFAVLVGISMNSHSKKKPCFRYEGKTGEERNLVIFEDTFTNNHINKELSTRRFH